MQLFIRPPSSIFVLKHTSVFQHVCCILVSLYISESLEPLAYLETFRKIINNPGVTQLLTLRTKTKNEKPWRIMSDLSLLVFNESNRRQVNEIMADGTYRDLRAVLRVCGLFHNMYLCAGVNYRDALEREMDVHVEMESDSWINVFCLLYELNRLLRNFALCFAPTEVPRRDMIYVAVDSIIRNILATEMVIIPSLVEKIEFNNIKYGISESSNPGVSSLHHPLHYFLSLCISSSMTSETHRPGSWEFMRSIFMGDKGVLEIMESCIGHYSLISQIQAGFWVRNGASVT